MFFDLDEKLIRELQFLLSIRIYFFDKGRICNFIKLLQGSFVTNYN